MTPERLSHLTTLYTAYQLAVKEVTAEVERLYGPQDGPPERWVWETWGEMLEARPEWRAMHEADSGMTASERSELAVMAGVECGRLEELLWLLAHRRLE